MDGGSWAIIASILATPLVAFVTWFFNRPKYVSEIYQTASQSSHNAMESMQIAMTTLNSELASTQAKVKALTDQIEGLQKQLLDFKVESSKIEADNVRLRVQVYELTSSLRTVALDEMQDDILRSGD